MRCGYMPPGDTYNLKYWERDRIRHYRPITRLGLRLLKAESGEASPRYRELVQTVGSMTTDIELFNHWNNNRHSSPWEDTIFIAGYRSHISYIVHGDVYMDVIRHYKFARLGGISNLGITQFEIPDAKHKRGEHSILAAIMAELVLRNNGFPEKEVNLGIISALLHDIAIPPFSDYGKLACPDELDEEKNIEDVLADGSFDGIFYKYGLTREEVIETVRGKGIIGKLINSRQVDLDKIAYTSVDLKRTYGADPWGRMRVVNRDPYVFDLFEDVKIVDGNIVYTDPQRLFRFLLTRALMFEKIHFSPVNRARETYIKRILQELWGSGKITKDLMLESCDGWFLRILDLGKDERDFTALSFPIVEVGRYETLEQAQEAHRGEDVLIDRWRSFNPATTTLTIKKGKKVDGKFVEGNPIEFRGGFPEKAKIIEDIVKSQEYVGVYRREEASHVDLELEKHVTKKGKAETMGVPRKILRNADVEPVERIIWALEQVGRSEEAQKMRDRFQGELTLA